MSNLRLSTLFVFAATACAGHAIKPSIDPGPTQRPTIQLPPAQAAEPAQPSVPPDSAYRRGLMPLRSTGIIPFLRGNPAYDGRGVLIGILDSGIDAGVDGLAVTTTGRQKILDLRDFSGEGAIPLSQLRPEGDTVMVDGVRLAGFRRVLAFNVAGPYYGGILREIPLGNAPAADVDGNGRVGDSLAIVVTRASDGWVIFVDTDRDGSLATERPIHDYLVGHETFGWARPGHKAPLSVAANLSEDDGRPRLDLFFDTSGHGTHVSGIAAGYNIYGVKGFNGVAPGAQLLGLKIANNAQGGISTTGSMLRAMDYAIRFAAERRLPLVLNMSFGVGNEIEGTARMDRTGGLGTGGPSGTGLHHQRRERRARTLDHGLPRVRLPGGDGGRQPSRRVRACRRGRRRGLFQFPRRGTGQARHLDARRGLLDRSAVGPRRGAVERNQHGFSPRGRTGRPAGLRALAGGEADPGAPGQAGPHGDRAAGAGDDLHRRRRRGPRRRGGLDLAARRPPGTRGRRPRRRSCSHRRHRGVPSCRPRLARPTRCRRSTSPGRPAGRR